MTPQEIYVEKMTKKDASRIWSVEDYKKLYDYHEMTKSELVTLSKLKVDDIADLAQYKHIIPNKYQNILNDLQAILETIQEMN